MNAITDWLTANGGARSLFHSSDGFCFGRLPDGSVLLVKTNNRFPWDEGAVIESRTVLSAEAWASVVSTLSLRSETFATWSAALAFHNIDDVPDLEGFAPPGVMGVDW